MGRVLQKLEKGEKNICQSIDVGMTVNSVNGMRSRNKLKSGMIFVEASNEQAMSVAILRPIGFENVRLDVSVLEGSVFMR